MASKKIAIDKIVTDYHPRQDFSGKEELKKSIEKNGLIDPILVRPAGDGFIVIDGQLRLQSCKEFGWTEIDCIVQEVDEKKAAHLSFLRNCESLNHPIKPLEESYHIEKMLGDFEFSITDLVELGSYGNQATIYNKLSLLKLPEEIQQKVYDGTISPTVGYGLAKLKDKDFQIELVEKIVSEQGLSTRKIKKMISAYVTPATQRQKAGNEFSLVEVDAITMKTTSAAPPAEIIECEIQDDTLSTDRPDKGRAQVDGLEEARQEPEVYLRDDASAPRCGEAHVKIDKNSCGGKSMVSLMKASEKKSSSGKKASRSIPLNKIILGDCLDKLKQLPDNFVDSIVADPPYGIEFMGKDWDKALPSVEILKEGLRVMKHGAFAFIMCSPRQDCLARMMNKLEDAGFDINYTSIYWTYAAGFPKAHNIGKALSNKPGIDPIKTKNADGAYAGFQPKPAVEVVLVAMKPLNETTFTDQYSANGKGVTYMGNCRIPYRDENEKWRQTGGTQWSPEREWGESPERFSHDDGRFPPNLLVSDDVLNDGKNYKSGKMTPLKHKRTKSGGEVYNGVVYGKRKFGDQPLCETYGDEGSYSRFFSLDAWWGMNLKDLPEEVRQTFPFLIVPKASRKEKDAGLEDVEEKVIEGRDPGQDARNVAFKARITPRKNIHPTVKPIKLMSYLITLGSREGDVILDPFVGSGTTCIAAKMLKRQYVGIEKDPEYHAIAEKRLESLDMEDAA